MIDARSQPLCLSLSTPQLITELDLPVHLLLTQHPQVDVFSRFYDFSFAFSDKALALII